MQWIKYSLVLMFLLVELCSTTERPHIVFILADDLGWADVSWNDPKIISPNLEELYNNSLKLENYYVQHICTPSRAAILTGYYPLHLGLQHSIIKPTQPSYLPLNVATLPEKLKLLGYSTAAVGKWHLGFCDWLVTPTFRGFDQFYGMWLGSQDHYTHKKKFKGVKRGLDFRDNLAPVYDQDGEYSVHSHTRRAVKIIEEHDASAPLFLYLPYQNVHGPLQVPQEYMKMNRPRFTGKRRVKAAMVTALDEAIGNVTKALREKGLMEDTILIFSSDNGGPVETAGLNFPYRGNKGTLYEGGTKAVGFIHGKMLGDGKFEGLFHAVDWVPTLLKAAGFNQSLTNTDGIDQWEGLLQNTTSREEFVYNIDELNGNGGIRVGQYKLLMGHQGKFDGWYQDMQDVERQRGLSKLARASKTRGFPHPSRTEVMLFDLENDPYERNDLSDSRPDLVARLYSRLQRYKNTMIPAFWPPLDGNANPRYFNNTWSPGWCQALAQPSIFNPNPIAVEEI